MNLKKIFEKNMSIGSCTCSSYLTHFLPIQQEFVFFTRGVRKGLRSPCWDIVHIRRSNIFVKYGGIILNYPFGVCFTKPSVFYARKMENGFLVRRKGKLPPATL